MPEIAPVADRSSAYARPAISLDGIWNFAFHGPTAQLQGSGHEIRVPGIWQTQFPELRNAHGTGLYQKHVELPLEWHGKRIFLVAEGIFHSSTIRINGNSVATHENGWTTIELDLTSAIGDTSAFTLGIDAHVPDDRNYDRESYTQTLAGKQDWYGIHGGIWKPIRLETRSAHHLSDVAIQTSTDLKAHAVTVTGRLSESGTSTVRLVLSGKDGVCAQQDFPLSSDQFDLTLPVTEVALWSTAAPELYEVSVIVVQDGIETDSIIQTVGFRMFESRDGKLFLNGVPFYMFGALDQDWYPQEDCRSPDATFLEQRFINAKKMGLNTLRCHVKIPDKLYFELADRLGLIVWLDMPYMEFLAPSTRDALKETFQRSVATYAHHPSIAIWTIINEGWGIDLDDNPDDRRWLKDTFDEVKKLVPTSLVVDNSPCFPRNYHVKTDIEDFHWYTGFPTQNEQFAKITDEFAHRAPWAWSPHGDAVKSGKEPLICSEFGVWGLPHPRDIRDEDGREPWWFESGHDWNGGAGYPHGIETRFRDAQLAPLFGDLDGFVDAAQEFQYRALKYQIETIRWAAPISGYVITELNDVQWEANGLMDANNNPRRFAERLANLQKTWLVVGRTPRSSIGCGERISVQVRLCGAGDVPAGTVLNWSFADQAGTMMLSDTAKTLEIIGPAADMICVRNLELDVRDSAGVQLSTNMVEMCVVPKLVGEVPKFFAADTAAADLLTALDWSSNAASAEYADVILATQLTTPVRELLLDGRKVLLIANDTKALVDPTRTLPYPDLVNFPKMEVKERDGTFWDGRWMGAFSWRRTDGPWAGLPNGPMLDEHWAGLVPQHVLTGFRSTAFGGLIDAGMAVAWLHKAAGFTKRSFLGKGWMTVSTFDMTSNAAIENPLAAHVLLALAKS